MRTIAGHGAIARVVFILPLLLAIAPSGGGSAEAANLIRSVDVRVEPPVIEAGESVTIHVDIEKTSQRRLSLGVTATVYDASGQTVARQSLPVDGDQGQLTGRHQGSLEIAPQQGPGDYRVDIDVTYTRFVLVRQAGAARFTVVEPVEVEPSPAPTPVPEPDPEPQPPLNPTPDSPKTIQEMVDAAEPGATVSVPAGTYRETVYITKPIRLVGEPGATIDGEDRERWIVGRASDVTIEGFTFINSDQPQYHGGLSNDGYDNWTIRNNTFLDAGNAAIALKEGSGHLIENNEVARSGSVGIRVESVDGATIRGNKTHGNNPESKDTGWEAGGMKITGNYGGVRNLIIEDNESSGNNGPGIWIDIDAENVEIRHNRVYGNSRAGIHYELSFEARIYGNTVYDNGAGFDAWGFGAGILLQNSSNVEVFDNLVAWNADGVIVISQDRGAPRWNDVSGNSIHDNTIISDHDASWNMYGLAWLEDWEGVLSHPESGNQGHANRFWFTSAEGEELRFRWCEEAFWTVTGFSNSPGGQSSRYLSDSEKDQILAAAGVASSPYR